jgi:glycosyltransferase involved in cell wall biosynthesis
MALRVVIIARQFWPQTCEQDAGLAELAAGLVAAGSLVTVLTPRWQPESPPETVHRGVRIVRLAPPSTRRWGRDPFLRGTADWLKQSAGGFDLVYVSGLKFDAQTALAASADGQLFPVILRPAAAGLKGDVYWQLEAPAGRRIKSRCVRAAGFVASNRAIERELIAAGFPRGKIHYIADGVVATAERTATAKDEARQALAAAQPALGRAGPVAVYVGGLADEGLADLVGKWSEIVLRFLDARLWLVGDRRGRVELANLIDDLGLGRHVILAGTFDSLDEVFTAADLFVLPLVATHSTYSALQAMAAGLPVVALQNPVTQSIVTHDQHGVLVPPEQPGELVTVIAKLFDQPELAQRLGNSAHIHAAEEFALAETVRRHQLLFSQTIAELAKRYGMARSNALS